MKPLISVSAISIKFPIVARVSKDRHSLEGVFGGIPNSLYEAARLNITFTEEETFGTLGEDGNFDGIIGMLQRNESDFAVYSMAIELLRGVKEMPVKILRLMGQQDYFIETAPYYNRTEFTVQHDVEDTVLIISPGVSITYLMVLIGTVMFICSVAKFLRKSAKIVTFVPIKVGNEIVTRIIKINDGKIPTKVSKFDLAWNMSRYFIGQGSEVSFAHRCQLYAFTSFVFSVGILLCLFGNQMSSDLVNYRKPILIDTLQDLWDAGNTYKISFIKAISTAGVFKHKSSDSLERKLLQRSIEQWSNLPENEENLHLYPAEKTAMTHWNIIKHRLAFLSFDFPSRIVLGLECSRADDDPDLYSNIYRSKTEFMFENQVQVSRIGIDSEVEERLTTVFTRAQEFGLHELQIQRGHEWVLDTLDLPFGSPRLLCLNVNSWSDENNEQHDQLKLEHCYKFLFHISLALIPIVESLTLEIFIHNFSQLLKE